MILGVISMDVCKETLCVFDIIKEMICFQKVVKGNRREQNGKWLIGLNAQDRNFTRISATAIGRNNYSRLSVRKGMALAVAVHKVCSGADVRQVGV